MATTSALIDNNLRFSLLIDMGLFLLARHVRIVNSNCNLRSWNLRGNPGASFPFCS